MPTYQYRCEECGMTFERTETISELAATPKAASKLAGFASFRRE